MIPVISSPLTASGNVGQPFSYQILAMGDPTNYNASNLPSGFSVNTSLGIITGVPQTTGIHDIIISASNLDGTGSATLRLSVAAALPEIITPLDGRVGEPFVHTVVATNATSFTAFGLPPGLSITSTGAIVGTPTQEGTFTADITATSALGSSTCTAVLVITIAPQMAATPVITSATTVTARQGQPFTYQITATNDPSSFDATELPAGLSIDGNTGAISGTPISDPGIYQATLHATNALGTGTAILWVTLFEALPPQPIPVIVSADTASGTVGLPFTYVISALNNPRSFNAHGLPDGLMINTLTGSILGTPKTQGTFHIQLDATNNAGTGVMTLVLVISPAPEERPCPPPPPTRNFSGPDTPGIFCYTPDGCCGPDICTLDQETFICQIRTLLPEGEIFNNTRKSIGDPPRNVGAITVGCARVGCDQLVFGGCCEDDVYCTEEPIAPQLAVVDSFAAVAYQMIQALCRMLPELDPCTANRFVEKWAERMGISRMGYEGCPPQFSHRILAFLICFLLQLRYSQQSINWDFLTSIASRMGAQMVMRYAGDMNGTANSPAPLTGWWTMARDQPQCDPIVPCPPEDARVGMAGDRTIGGRSLDEVACAPQNQNSPLSLNIIICPADIVVPENCNLPTAQQNLVLPHDREMYLAFWWLLPQLLPRGPLYCIYECCPADCIV